MISSPKKYVLWMTGVSAIAGFVETFFRNNKHDGALVVAHMLIFSFLLFAWCGAHADANNIKALRGSKLFCGLVGLIGVPLYFFRSFGFKQGCIGTLKAMLVFILITIVFVLGSAVAAQIIYAQTKGTWVL
jgi:hypothetical protein